MADRHREDGAAKRSRAVGLFVWGLVLLVFCAWAIYQLIPHATRTHVVTAVVRYDRECELTPLPWQDPVWRDDPTALADLLPRTRWTGLKDDVMRGQGLLDLARHAPAACELGPRDMLIVMLSAYGSADAGEPCVLMADFEARGNPAQHVQLSQLLEAIARVKAGPKLLVLDLLPLPFDPRLGRVELDLPSLVESAVTKMSAAVEPDPLWVLLPSRTGELPQVSFAERDTLFGRAVRDALAGYADRPECRGDGNGRVSVGELYRYVAVRCRARSGNEQTPLLLRSGRGTVSPAGEEDDTAVVEVLPPRDEAVEAEQKTPLDARAAGDAALRGLTVAEGGADRAASDLGRKAGDAALAPRAPAPAAKPAEPAASADSAADAAAGKKEGAGQGAAAPAPGEPPQPKAEAAPQSVLAAPVAQLWQLHEALGEGHDVASSDVRPLDYAPAYWRWMEAQLVDWDLRLHWGSQAVGSVAADPQSLLAELKAVRRDADADPTLLAATRWLQEREAATRRATESASHPLRQRAERTLRTYLRLVYRARDLVLWHARWTLVSPAAVPRDRDRALADYLQHLESFGEALAGLLQRAQVSAEDFDREVQRLEQQLGRRDTPRSLLGEYHALLESVHTDVDRASTDQVIFCCLLSPLLTPAQRESLYTRLAAQQVPDPSDLGPDAEDRWVVIREDVRRPAGRSADVVAQWYLRLCALGSGRRASDALPSEGMEPQSLPAVVARTVQDLDRLVAQSQTTVSQRLQLELAARTADPRDVERGRLNLPNDSLVRVELTYPDIMTVAVEPGEQLALRRLGEEAARLVVTLRATDPNRRETGWKLAFNPQELAVTRAGQTQPLLPGDQPRLALSAGQAQVELLVTPRGPASPEPRTEYLTIETTDGDAPASRRLACLLPRDTVVELAAETLALDRSGQWIPIAPVRWEIPLEQRTHAALRLEPLPNRETRYAFRLRNRGESALQLKLQLVAVRLPADLVRSWPQGRLTDGRRVFQSVAGALFDSGQQLRPGLPVLAAGDVTLPADEEAPLLLAPPVPAADAAAPPAAAAAPAAPPAVPTATPIAEGLLAILTGQRPEERWLKWIEIAPLHPQYLVAAQGARLERERLTVTFLPGAAAAALPGINVCLDEQPGQFLPLGAPQVIPVRSDEFEKTLAVDGVPRSLVLRPAAADPADWRDQRRDVRNVALKGLVGQRAAGGEIAFVTPEFRLAWQPPAPAGTDPTKISSPRIIGSTPPVFPKLQSLRLDLAVDAPLNAFVPGSQDEPPREFVTVRLTRDDDARTLVERWFFEDRVWSGQGETRDGQLSIRLDSMEDLSLSVPSGGDVFPPESGEYTLETRLQLTGYPPLSTKSPVRLIVDADAPQQVVVQGLPPAVPEGRETITLRISCRDLTGPRKVAYAFVAKASDPLPAEAAVKNVTPTRQLRDQWSAEIVVNIADLKAAPNNRSSNYYFKALVWDEAENATAIPPADVEPPGLRVLPPAMPATKGDLTVFVRWKKNNEAIPGASVTVTGPGGQKLVRDTDAGGKATFTNLDFGSYTVEATQARYKGAQTVELKEGQAQVTIFPSSL
jgi:hypothetical protein